MKSTANMLLRLNKICILLWCIILLFTGCVGIPHILKGTGPSTELSVLNYYHWVESLTVTECRNEIQKLKERRDLDPMIKHLQLAMLLSIPERTTPEDDELAKNIIEQEIKSSDSKLNGLKDDYRRFALIWIEVLKDRMKQTNLLNDLNSQVHDLEKKNEILLKQIEALKSIEKQINKREISQDIEQ